MKRSIDGIVDFCLNKAEEIDGMEELPVETRTKLSLACLKETRNFLSLDLQHKKLASQIPQIIADDSISMKIGSKDE